LACELGTGDWSYDLTHRWQLEVTLSMPMGGVSGYSTYLAWPWTIYLLTCYIQDLFKIAYFGEKSRYKTTAAKDLFIRPDSLYVFSGSNKSMLYFQIHLNLFSSWICIKYLPLDVKQQTINQPFFISIPLFCICFIL
jgi:hypothetical protein